MDCPNISFLEIEIEKNISDYKPYLEDYLTLIGNKKTNLFTDISNYVSYQLGQPTHCYDRKTINKKLIFENKECNSKFKTLLGTEINLIGKNCVFLHGDEIINLAGVMGSESTACSSNTKKVLIECAYFNPESIIGKTIKYNLNSDAAHKFERGVDILSHEKVLRRFIKIVEDHVNIKSLKFKSFSSNKTQFPRIPFDLTKVNKVLGTNIKESEYSTYLDSLGFKIDKDIQVPSYRSDIKTQNDLAEEIARIIGYDNIDSSEINLKEIIKNENKLSKIESHLIRNGFTEVVNFPFTDNHYEQSILIDNPLDSNKKYFRTSLKDSLIQNMLYNERRQHDSIKLFEISDIYSKSSQIDYEKKLGIIITGRIGHNYVEFSKKLDHEYLNEVLNGSFEIIEISRSDLNTKKKDKNFLC